MKNIDYIYRFNPNSTSLKLPPGTAELARQELESGNRMFAEWVKSCQSGSASPGKPKYVVECSGISFGSASGKAVPHQDPFAIVIGCSDARVPIEMIFGQGFNELFVIRVAGNVLADECWGSIDYAIQELIETVKLVVVMGHSGCGAVTAAVDTYIHPEKYALDSTSLAVRSILRHIFVSVHRAANGLLEVWGRDAPKSPKYRDALIEISVCLNAAAAAHSIRVANEQKRHANVQVVYGVYDLRSHRVSMPPAGRSKRHEAPIRLADAPGNAAEFDELARELAARFK
jgi:carbonic anhydrase